MRTTVTIDPAVEGLIKKAMAARRHSFKRVLNDALRKGLADVEGDDEAPFEVRPHDMGFRPGVDPASMSSLADELEVDAFVELTRQLIANDARQA